MTIMNRWFAGLHQPDPECDPKNQIPPEPPEWVQEWDAFVAEHPVGSTMKHLGVDLTVVRSGASFFMPISWVPRAGFWEKKPVVCEYVDTTGVIHTKEFHFVSSFKTQPNDTPTQ